MAPLMQKLHHNHTIFSAARFAVVGMMGTMVDFALFFAAQAFLHLPVLPANTISYGAGILNNYYLHRTWTFAVRPQKAMRAQFSMFVMVSLIALAINSAVVFTLKPLLATHLPDPALAALLAKICATAAGIGWNFFANHRWTFGG